MTDPGSQPDQVIRQAIRNSDVKALSKLLFGWDVTPGQEEIVRAIVFDRERRLVVATMTRYGKSRSIALAILLHILMNPGRSVAVVAPQMSQAQKVRDYIGDFVVGSPVMQSLVDIDARGMERLRNEVTKQRVTFRNGCELVILSAEGEALRLMGEGASGLLILEESCLVDKGAYTSKIRRMLGDSPDAQEVQIGNPWNRHNQFWEAWQSDDYRKIHIGWRQALGEGRITEEFIEEQRRLLTDYEFKVLYEAEFPETQEGALIRFEHLKAAEVRDLGIAGEVVHGLDVAERGSDLTILASARRESNKYAVTGLRRIDAVETMDTVGEVRRYVKPSERIFIDSIGVGAGVFSRLKELGYDAVSVRVSQSPTAEADRFVNMKSQLYWRLRGMFEDGQISIPNDAELRRQLSEMRYDFTSGGKIRIIDPPKSPDRADAVMLCVAGLVRGEDAEGSAVAAW